MAEASPICRGKNLTLETVLSFVEAMPKEAMPKSEFYAYGEARLKGWKQTHSQIARQMALYYEDGNGICHPRFTSIVSAEDVYRYATNWASKYFVPNPYTPSIRGQTPTNIYAHLKKCVQSGISSYSDALGQMFDIKLNNTDKVRVYLNNFTDIIIDEDNIKLNDAISFPALQLVHPEVQSDNAEWYFNYFSLRINPTNIAAQTVSSITSRYKSYLSAIRTKPFLLLAGISGTGKSRIVKEMAYASCPDEGDLREDKTSPGNYCLVEVKPNWNDSTELLGYETVLDGGNYHLTKFVKFLIKAMQYKNVPFFVCLDEMNLAAVEQYFAEFLSILESRKDVDGTIKSEPLIPAAIFEKYKQKLHEELFPTKDSSKTSAGAGYYTADDGTAVYLHGTYAKLMEEGLRIPRNLIVVGTVNMDDTTYQFSRKVIDRAMTIEMNEVNLNDMFDTEKPDALSYREDVVDKGWFFAPFAQSNVALQQMNDERELLAEKIKATIGQTNPDGTQTPNSLEAILGKTPFRIAYRVVNELILHFYALRWENKDAEFESLYNKALDNILMMKVLPRIEGNEDLVKEPLAQLETWTAGAYPKANAKIEEMRERLECAHFTSFWP